MIKIKKVDVKSLSVRNNKALIFDSSSIISLAMSSLLGMLQKLKNKFNGSFLVPYDVINESVIRPLGIKRFEFEAMMIKKLVDNGVLTVVDGLHIGNLLDTANTIFKAKGSYIKIMHKGEIACIGLYKRLEGSNKIAFVVDERTTRMLCENPYNLKELLSSKLHTKVIMNEEKAKQFSNINIIRSTELGLLALKYGFINDIVSDNVKDTTEALLYSLRYHGCSISTREIKAARRII